MSLTPPDRRCLTATTSQALLFVLALGLAACGGGGGGGGSGSGSGPTLALFAGNVGGAGNANGSVSVARFDSIRGIAADSAGDLYVTDDEESTLRKITPAGTVSTLAGAAGEFERPWGLAVDSTGNVYVADIGACTIRKVTRVGVVTTVAGTVDDCDHVDGTGTDARFSSPAGMAFDGAGNLYVGDFDSCTLRKMTPAGVVTTLAGSAGDCDTVDGTGTDARFMGLIALSTDGDGNVYAAEPDSSVVRKVTPAGVVTTLAGSAGNFDFADGTGTDAIFGGLSGVASDADGNLYVADDGNRVLRKITPAGVVTTFAGSVGGTGAVDGTGTDARFNELGWVTLASDGNLYVADSGNATIRKVTLAGVVTTVAGSAALTGGTDATGKDARFDHPTGIAFDASGILYVMDRNNGTVRKITSAGVVTTLAGSPGAQGSANGTGSDARFNTPATLAVDSTGNVYVVDTNNHTIRKITPTGVVSTFAGSAGSFGSADGTGAAARFFYPHGVAVDSIGTVYVADNGNGTIRKITPAGEVTTFAGAVGQLDQVDGTGTDARFNGPEGMVTDSAGNLYVADSGNCTIRKITPAAVVTTVGGGAGDCASTDGTGMEGRFLEPTSLAIDGAGNLYVGDVTTVRKVIPAGPVTTVVGKAGTYGFAPGSVPGLLMGVNGVAIRGNSLYITTANGVAVVTPLP